MYGPNWSDPQRDVAGQLRDSNATIRPRETRVIDGKLRTVFLDEKRD